MKNPLQNENPKERYLTRHPIHGQGWVDENDYRNVDNYPDPHIRAKNTPPRIWPENASDWGLQLWVPSQNDMAPGTQNKVTGFSSRPHPVLVSDGRYEWEEMDYSVVWAAFYYTYVHPVVLSSWYRIPNLPNCSLRRSTRFTHWTIDEDTDEIIMDDCWGCRRLDEDCSMRGYRVARKAIHGDPIIGGREKKLPAYGQIEIPDGWKPPRLPPGALNGVGQGRHGGWRYAGRGGGVGGFGRGHRWDDGSSDDGSSDGEDRGGGDHGHGNGRVYSDQEDSEASPGSSSNGTRAGSTQQSRRPNRNSGKQYRKNGGKPVDHRDLQYTRPRRSGPRSSPKTPHQRKRQRAQQTDEDDDDGMDSPLGRRRLSNHELPQIRDLFRDDSDDDMHYDLNLGTFDNGRRDANVRNPRRTVLISRLPAID